MKRIILLLSWIIMSAIVLRAEVKVKDVTVKPRWPWNGLVDITYSIECDEVDDEGKPKDVYVMFEGIDNVRAQKIAMRSLTGDGARDAVKGGGPYTVVWDAGRDCPNYSSSAFQVKIQAMAGLLTYLVVDLSGGSSATIYPVRFSKAGPDLSNDICRTTELWLRQIKSGTFTMGSPVNEVGRVVDQDMAQHEVTLTQMFYIGVFECTQKQWELIMKSNPSDYKGESRPVERVSYNMIRGTSSAGGAGWPTYGYAVDATSFMGKLREKTGMTFDLPTEAQWEYACRAGTTTALNSGRNLTNPNGNDPAMNEVGRYNYNQSNGKGGYTSRHTKVGSYRPNAWGLYDMHGNVWEWCLDQWGANVYSTASEVDPTGPILYGNSLQWRIERGGRWVSSANVCRSAIRYGADSSYNGDNHIGFRIVYLPFKKLVE